MHDPQTLAFSFPPYGGALYRLKSVIGFDIWHVDPERPTEGQRSDDSCGWFDRRPREYADAVVYVLAQKDVMHEIERSIATAIPVTGCYGHTYPRMPLGETLAICLLVARELELRRWWNGQNGQQGACHSRWRKLLTRKRRVDDLACDLALTVYDNLSSIESAEGMVRLIAAALHRRFKPWWRHPRWHVHHWEVNIDLVRNVRRMFQRCAGCGKRFSFGYCPTSFSWDGNGPYFHGECARDPAAVRRPTDATVQ